MWPKPGNLQALSNLSAFYWFTATNPPKAVKLEELSGRSSGTATVESWQPRRVVLRIDALRDTVLHVNHFYYAGWRARIEGTNRQIAAHPSADGLLQVDVPQGRYTLVLELPRDGAERAGILVSIFSLLLVVSSAVWSSGRGPNVART